MNQYLAIGNLTSDPDYVVTEHQNYCNFMIAVNNRNEEPTFVEVVTYAKQATACSNHLIKGSLVCVKGLPIVRAYLDKQGNHKARLKVKAREVDFISKLRPKEVAALSPVSQESVL